MIGLKLDHFLDRSENKLTKLSNIPIIGTGAGCVKVLMGITQTIIALASLIFGSIPAYCIRGDSEVSKYSLKHIAHGLGNILAGTIELIPVIQQIAYYRRQVIEAGQPNACESSEFATEASYHGGDAPGFYKYMPYTP